MLTIPRLSKQKIWNTLLALILFQLFFLVFHQLVAAPELDLESNFIVDWIKENTVCNITQIFQTSCSTNWTVYGNKIKFAATKAICEDYAISSEKDNIVRNWFKDHTLYIASNQFNSEKVLFELISQLLEFFTWIGQENAKKNIIISIYENGSTDTTPDILQQLFLLLSMNGFKNVVIKTEEALNITKPLDRIKKLSIVRNRVLTLALEPMYELKKQPDFIYFVNDIYICWRDIVELLYHGIINEAHIVSGIDMVYENKTGEFTHYDAWVSRDIDGNPFLLPWHLKAIKEQKNQTHFPPIPPPEPGMVEANFSIHPETRERFIKLLPFQVSCTWGGAALLTPKPFFPPYNVNFCTSELIPLKERVQFPEERELDKNVNNMPQYSRFFLGCDASECSNLCKDFAVLGFKKIMMVPRVTTAYVWEEYVATRNRFPISKPFTEQELEKINWREEFPKAIFCMSWTRQYYLSHGNAPRFRKYPFGWEILTNQSCVRTEEEELD